MTFLADQYTGPKGCWVEFFGRPASAHKAIALLALEHDARVSVSSRGGSTVRCGSSCTITSRSTRGKQRLPGHGPRIDAVVHREARRPHPPFARSVLVASPALERHAGKEAGKTLGGVSAAKGDDPVGDFAAHQTGAGMGSF